MWTSCTARTPASVRPAPSAWKWQPPRLPQEWQATQCLACDRQAAGVRWTAPRTAYEGYEAQHAAFDLAAARCRGQMGCRLDYLQDSLVRASQPAAADVPHWHAAVAVEPRCRFFQHFSQLAAVYGAALGLQLHLAHALLTARRPFSRLAVRACHQHRTRRAIVRQENDAECTAIIIWANGVKRFVH